MGFLEKAALVFSENKDGKAALKNLEIDRPGLEAEGQDG